MKKRYTTIAVLVLLSTFTLAQVPSYVPTNGLVGWWPFTGNAVDSSGNGHDGTVYGATLISDRFGSPNCAYSYNGSSYISVPHNSAFSFGTGDYTLSAWAVRDGNNQWQEIISKTLPGPNYTGLQFRFGNSNIDFISGATFNGSWQDNGYVISPISNNIWYHFVGVFNPSNGLVLLYVNGVLVGSVASTVPLINPDNNNDLMFGVYQPTISVPSGPEFLTGKIDDIGIWNRALTQQEVLNLFQGTTQPPNCLVAYYPFTGNAADNSGNGNNGTTNGPTLTTDRFGNTNCAYFFNKVNIEYIEVNHSPTLDFLPEITLSLWTNIASYSAGGAGYNHFINKTDQSTDVQFVLASDTQGLYFYYGNHPLFFQTNTLPSLNQWHHLALTYKYDGTIQNSYCKFYIDGICTDSFPTNVSLNSSTYNLRIGSYSSVAYNTVDGKIDEVRIYCCALSEPEIEGIFNEIIDLEEEANFSISPNPTSSIAIIHSNTPRQNTHLEIFNMLGEKIYKGVFNSGQQTVNCQLFPTGFYFVIVRGANGSVVRKLVVNR